MSDAITNKLKQAYDELTYPSAAYRFSSPLRLEACASILGLKPVDTKNARVLEIGCSYGGNLIPFCIANPNAKAVGIDLSNEHIQKGKDIVQKMGIKNLELVQMDIRSLAYEDVKKYGKFDYIIAHGVFSWVPTNVRDAILNIIKEFLQPQGVAYFSYNVYPGWKVKDVLREIMLVAAKGVSSQLERVKKAKEALEIYKKYLIECKNETLPADQLIHHINDILLKPANYIAHEFLENVNQPFYFLEFTQMLEKRELSYLCESGLDDVFAPKISDGEVMKFVDENMSDRYEQEQFMDFFTNKTFRASLVVHKAAYDSVHGREISANDIAKLNVVADFAPHNGKWVSRSYEPVSDENAWLCEVYSKIYPQSANLVQLLEFVEPNKKLNTYMALLEIVSLKDVNFALRFFDNTPYEVGKTRLKPEYANYIKYFLDSDDNFVSFANCRNENIKFTKLDCYLALKFDGVNTLAQIADEYLSFTKKNDIKLVGKDNKELKGEKLKKHAMLAVTQLEFTLREAYFIGEYIS